MSSKLSGLDIPLILLSLLVNSIYPVFVHRCGWLLPPAASTSYLEAPFKAEHAAGERGREGGREHILRLKGNLSERRIGKKRGRRAASGVTDRLAE